MLDARHVRAILNPRGVALIGASSNPAKLTARPLTFLRQHGFAGEIVPVNPAGGEIAGLPVCTSIAALPSSVDHAYVLLDAEGALEALEACGKAGIKVVSLLADGFAESGPEGAARQRRLVEIAKSHGTTLIGPNSTGVVVPKSGFACTTNAAFAAPRLAHGRCAVLSQSGSMIGAILSRAEAVGLGFGAYVSVGNEAMTGVGELGLELTGDASIHGFALFLETLRRPERIAAFARAARAAGKPVLAYLVGRSDQGAALAASHTGAMTGGARAIEAFLRAHDIHLMDTLDAMIEGASAFASAPRLRRRPPAVTVVTSTGGGGGMVYDKLAARGLRLRGMSDASRAALAARGIRIKPGPLVDLTLAGTRYETFRAVMRTLAADPDTGTLVAAIGSSAQFNPELSVKPIVDTVEAADEDTAPVLAIPIPHAPDSLALFNAAGVPAFRTAESLAEVLCAMLRPPVERSAADGLPTADAVALPRHASGTLSERDAGAVLAERGVRFPATVFLPSGEDVPDPLPFDGPCVLKVVSADIAHKSDVGGVRVGLADRAAVRAALDTMRTEIARRAPDAAVDGHLLVETVEGIAEAIVGFTRDPVTGPMISVGMGGLMTEIYRDIAMRPAPVDAAGARAMFEEVRGFAVLRGYRGAPPADLDALAELVACVSQLAGTPRVQEAEINPVAVCADGQGVVALDALIRVTGPA